MQSKASTVEQYLDELPADRKKPVAELRKIIKKNLPKGFQEMMCYGMIGWVVPHSKYPDGYHCNPEQPLPFMNLASQKNTITVYHMGVYSNPALLKWLTTEYQKATGKKVDMGKSCLRFKKPEDIPYELIGRLATKVTPDDWIAWYEKAIKSRAKK